MTELYQIVDSDHGRGIRWHDDGDKFVIYDKEALTETYKQVFDGTKVGTFMRQLSHYRFSKVEPDDSVVSRTFSYSYHEIMVILC